jgi:photosystem II stability/assembly factor-like uncharacterized protein
MKLRGGNKRLALFVILALLLGLQLLFLSLATAVAASGGWITEYTNDSEGIYGVSAVDANTCWAVGQRQTLTGVEQIILKTTDAGSSWTSCTPSSTEKLTCISAIDANTCYVGGMGIIIKTTSGGTSWDTVHSNGSRAVMGISAVDSNTCWAVGSNPNLILDGFIIKTSNGGATWDTQVSGLPYPMMAISAVDSTTCWAAGGTFNLSSVQIEGSIMKTTDLGQTWTNYGSSDRAYWDVSALSGDVVWANAISFTLEPISLASECHRSINGGSDWTISDSPSFYTPFSHGLQACDADTAWLANVGTVAMTGYITGCIYKTSDVGGTWNPHACVAQDQQLTGLSGIDSNTAWAVGADIYNTTTPSKGIITHTTDGGIAPTPSLSGISPTSGYMGSEVTISGADFGSSSRLCEVSFANKQASVSSWSDTQIVCKVPTGLIPGSLAVTVTTLGGTSNSISFYVNAPAAVQVNSLSPTQESQFGMSKGFTVQGSGFQTGATVKLVKESMVIYATRVELLSSTEISCTFFFFGQPPGTYDVVVANPDGGEASLIGGFYLIPICGAGSGTALLMLGLALGLLSLAGTKGILRRLN